MCPNLPDVRNYLALPYILPLFFEKLGGGFSEVACLMFNHIFTFKISSIFAYTERHSLECLPMCLLVSPADNPACKRFGLRPDLTLPDLDLKCLT